ncbi:MAG TPA: hypothetical protein GX714_11235 [Chloroflexi bacterium]|jgi:hypothetical protein|nr:hypothetical protein [Chloroflexota bacterium]
MDDNRNCEVTPASPVARFVKWLALEIRDYAVFLPLGMAVWAAVGIVLQLIPALFLWFPLLVLVGLVTKLIGQPIIGDDALAILAGVVVAFYTLVFVSDRLRGKARGSSPH